MDDFPTLDLPQNATSGCKAGGNALGWGALAKKIHDFCFIIPSLNTKEMRRPQLAKTSLFFYPIFY
jgi:hypothetical protein